jgi:hypothetical protein
VVVIPYRRFETKHRSHLQSSRNSPPYAAYYLRKEQLVINLFIKTFQIRSSSVGIVIWLRHRRVRKFYYIPGKTLYIMRSESRCALRLQYVVLVVSIEVAVEVCCC